MRKVIKPLTLGVLAKPYRYRQQDQLAISALAFFSLGDEPRLLPEHEQWAKILPALPPMQVLDECMPKTGADVLVAGSAYAPKPVKKMQVRLQCADVDKTLEVIGDRQWRYGLVPLQRIETPVPFEQMPLTLARAWGGAGCTHNPEGCGFTESRIPALFGRNEGKLPNIQYPGDRLRAGWGKFRPAGFGPVSMGVPARSKLAGTYKTRWLQEDFPGYARDIDWRFFNMAPPDQRLDTHFCGGEEYCLSGMHPQKPQLQGRVPTIRARAFVQTAGQGPNEIPLQADTLWLFPGLELGVLIFHGHTPIGTRDATDVDCLMLAWEHNGQERTRKHYRRVWQLRTQPDTAHLHVFNESQLTPLQTAETTPPDTRRQQDHLDALNEDFWSHSGLKKPADYQPPTVPPPRLPAVDPKAMASGGLDLTALVEAADAQIAQLKADAEVNQAQLHQNLTEKFGPSWRHTPPEISASEALARANPKQVTRQMLKEMPTEAMTEEEAATVTAQMGQLVRDKGRLRRLAMKPAEESLSAQARDGIRNLFRRCHHQGTSMRGYDFSGIHLQGENLTGLDLSEVCFENARMTDCNFTGCRLQNTSFVGATLTGCDFTGTQLDTSNWSAANLVRCTLKNANLADTYWIHTTAIGTDYRGANLSGANIQQALFDHTNLSEITFDAAIWLDTELQQCIAQNTRGRQFMWIGCTLTGGDLRSAQWQQAALLGCNGEHSCFDDAAMHKVLITGQAGKSRWQGATWLRARLDECGFRGSDLQTSDFTDARIDTCDLGGVNLQHVRAASTLFHRCLLTSARMAQGWFVNADFCRSVAMAADFTGADLRDTNLWSVNLQQAVIDKANLKGAWPKAAWEQAA